MMSTTRGWRIKGWVWHTFAKQLWAKIHTDDLINRAAILSFYFLLALSLYEPKSSAKVA